jgi:hypothetical protein
LHLRAREASADGLLLLDLAASDDKKVKYLVVEGPEALAKLGNRDEVWYV